MSGTLNSSPDWVAADIAARHAKWALESKHCPACGSRWLGGVMGDRTHLGCTDCGQRVPRLLSDCGPNPRKG